MTPSPELRRGLALLGLALLWAPAWAEEDARAWLAAMSRAVQALDYGGVLIYQHDGQVEVMRILHRVAADGEHERIVSLSGAPREVIRDPKRVTCILPDKRAVVVEKSRPRRTFPGVLPLDLERVERHYELEVDGRDRVAGRSARIVLVRARDGFRYGYRFWVDEASRLPLKFVVLDERGRPIEQMMFTHIEVGATIMESALRPTLDTTGFTWYADEGDETGRHPESGRWEVTRRPPGFELTMHRMRRLPMSSSLVEHLMLTDGLASVSVYVDRPESSEALMEGLTRMGAISAFGVTVDGYQVTAVGEVPPATVELIARGVRRKGTARDGDDAR